MASAGYAPQLTTEASVGAEQASLREDMLGFFPNQGDDEPRRARLHTAFDDPAISHVFVQHANLVGRFISAELDPWSPSKRGIGRLVDGDPPPRLGALHRKALESSDARDQLGFAAERIVLASYLAQAGGINWQSPDTSKEAVRNVWLRGVVPHYHLLIAEIPRAQKAVGLPEPASDAHLTLATIYLCASRAGSDFVVIAESFGLMRGSLRPGRKRRLASALILFMAAGSALALAIQDRLHLEPRDVLMDPDRLENYEEPRKLRDIT